LVVNSEHGAKITEALNTLSPNQKMSFLLKHYEGYKIREIAEMMNCKEGTIKKYLFESVRKLRLQLENSY
ncbi:MAG: RNA polymerase sigma factor, partial [Ignavibacterium sp.]|nr:RNA polymerase sigma factor [Ignavibacterium sp.]